LTSHFFHYENKCYLSNIFKVVQLLSQTLVIIEVLGTDNRVVSGVTLSGEYQLIQKVFGFTVEEIVRMIDCTEFFSFFLSLSLSLSLLFHEFVYIFLSQ
jgi:hypothetical protein